MAVAGLFSGIGGFELGFSEAGFKTVLLVESDSEARAVLKAQFPDVEIREDVGNLDELPSDTTIVTAGFPCQNLSMAGDKSGISGSKSSIVKKMFELIERSKVPTVVIENVYFMLQLESGDGMRWLADQLERLEYKWAYRVLDTMGFGLPQRRRRVYLVASKNIDPRGVLFAHDAPPPATLEPDLEKPLGFYWTEGRSGIGLTVDGIPPLKIGSAVGIPSPPAVLFPDGQVLTPSISACERLQGFEPGWTTVDSEAAGRRPEWRMLGNAASVPVVRWVAERLKNPGIPREFPQVPIRDGRSWPEAAWNVGEGREGVAASDKPVSSETLSISDYRDVSWSLLSDRALNGFIYRAEKGGLRMPKGFLEALRCADRKIAKVA